MSKVLQAPSNPRASPPMPLYLTARIDILPDGRFRHDGSEPAIIVPVRDRYGLICDCVAYLDDDPGEWWLKEGDQSPVLGARELAIASAWGDPIAAHPTPEAWIKAGGIGICVLDWGVSLLDLFDGIPRVETNHLPSPVAAALADRIHKNFFKSVPFVERPRKEAHNAAA